MQRKPFLNVCRMSAVSALLAPHKEVPHSNFPSLPALQKRRVQQAKRVQTDSAPGKQVSALGTAADQRVFAGRGKVVGGGGVEGLAAEAAARPKSVRVASSLRFVLPVLLQTLPPLLKLSFEFTSLNGELSSELPLTLNIQELFIAPNELLYHLVLHLAVRFYQRAYACHCLYVPRVIQIALKYIQCVGGEAGENNSFYESFLNGAVQNQLDFLQEVFLAEEPRCEGYVVQQSDLSRAEDFFGAALVAKGCGKCTRR